MQESCRDKMDDKRLDITRIQKNRLLQQKGVSTWETKTKS